MPPSATRLIGRRSPERVLRFLLRAEAGDLLLRTPAVGTDVEVEPVAPRPTLGSRLAKTPLRRPAATSSLMNPWTRTRFERFPRPRQRIKIAAELGFLWSRVWESNPRPHDYKAHSERPSGVVRYRHIPSELRRPDLSCHAVSPDVGTLQAVRGHSVDTIKANGRRFDVSDRPGRTKLNGRISRVDRYRRPTNSGSSVAGTR